MSSPDRVSAAAWIADEPRFASLAAWLLSRSLHRRVLVLAITLGLAGGAVTWRALKEPSYEATLFFLLEEGNLTDPDHTPQPPRDIRQHIASVALSRQQLERIMTKSGRSAQWLARDREAAIEEFREDIEISVERNYFIYPRSPGDAPRSAHVTISLVGSDPERTRAILHEIGEAILSDQSARSAGDLEAIRSALRGPLALAHRRTVDLRRAIHALSREAAAADKNRAIILAARVETLRTELKAALEQELVLQRRAARVDFTSGAQRERLGTKLVLLDEHLATFAPRLTALQLAGRAAVAFAVALLLAAIVVGAFDDRIYDPQDLAAWGLPLFGALPRFPGDDARSYRARALQSPG